MPHSVPSSITEVTPAWMGTALVEAFPGNAVQSFQANRIGARFGLSSEIHRIQLEGSDVPVSVVLKLWSTEGPAGAREVRFFQEFGSRMVPRVPVCHHAAVDAGARRAVLVLEDLRDAVQGDCLDSIPLPRAKALAASLAALHSTWWENPAVRGADWLPPALHTGRSVEWYSSRRQLVLERFGTRLSGHPRRLLDLIESLVGTASLRLDRAAVTLLHGDLHLDNVLFDGSEAQPILLDWARTARGPAALDLADVIFALSQPGHTDEIVAAYLGALRVSGVSGPSEQEFRGHVGASMIMKFAAATCGVAHWQPASAREEAMIDAGLARAAGTAVEWRRREPELFEV